MAGMAVLVIGLDRSWRARMQRLLCARCEMEWLGAYAPMQRRPEGRCGPALLLLDGDDPRIERECRRPLIRSPRRLYFFSRPNPAALLACISAKASACLDKLAPAETVLRALRAAESGLFVAAPSLLWQAVRGSDVPDPVPAPGDWSTLTIRQREILHWTVNGMSNKQIARQLRISPETVKSHLQHVFQRGGVHGRMALFAAHHHAGAANPRANPRPESLRLL
jgi:DNA-binding NarL/FixJ family response regulator